MSISNKKKSQSRLDAIKKLKDTVDKMKGWLDKAKSESNERLKAQGLNPDRPIDDVLQRRNLEPAEKSQLLNLKEAHESVPSKKSEGSGKMKERTFV